MFEFLNFLKSLVKIILSYIYNRHLEFFSDYYRALSVRIMKKPKDFIIWPLLVGFILSYPSLFSLYSSFGNFDNSHVLDLNQLNNSITSMSPITFQFSDEFVLRQIWLSPKDGISSSDDFSYLQSKEIDPIALKKSFLLESMNFQNYLLNNLTTATSNETTNDKTNNGNTSTNESNQDKKVFVHSIFNIWSNDINKLAKDKNPLKTIHVHSLKSQDLSYNSLLSGVKKINGFIKSVNAIRIFVLYKNEEQLDTIWNNSIEQFSKNDSSPFKIVVDESTDRASSINQNYLLKIIKVTKFDHVFLSTCYLFILTYILISISNLTTVRSKLGLLVAYVVQVSLSILSSATIIKFFFKSVDFHQVPLEFLPFIVIVVSVENMFRLITALSDTPSSLSIQYKFNAAATESGLKSTLIVLCNLIVLLVVHSVAVPSTQIFCLFAAIALVIDHGLHLTYFQAILIIDSLRIELKDLLDEKDTATKTLDLSNDAIPTNRFVDTLKTYKKAIKLPFSTSIAGSLVVVSFLIGTNIRWSGNFFNFGLRRLFQSIGPTQDINDFIIKDFDIVNFFDRKIFSSEILKLLEHSNYKLPNFSKILIKVSDPLIAVPKDTISLESFPNAFHLDVSYSFDGYYILEFLTLLVLVMSLTLVILSYFTSSLTNEYDLDNNMNKKIADNHILQAKVLSGGHFLDIIKISTAPKSPFIVSLGLDHKVLVWSPMSRPLPTPAQLPLTSKSWPITHIVLSDNGNYIAIFSKSGQLQCWSRSSKTWIWKVQIDQLQNSIPLESFFRKKTIPAFLQRKKANDLLKAASDRPPNSRRNSMRSIISLNTAPNVAFENNTGVSDDSEGFVIVLKNGFILSVSCETGEIKTEQIIKGDDDLVSSALVITPRVNDRLVSVSSTGKVLVSTAVNNKWKTRTVTVFENQFYLNNSERSASNELSAPRKPEAETVEDFSKSAIAIVPFVGFMVKASDKVAELIDVQTGILIMKFSIRPFQKNTFKVFHDQPTHCRFCGSASISSFSAVYTLLGTNTVVMHTFKVDHRAKKSICLRVERDVREIRCIGFNSVLQDICELENVECWSATDNNQIIGISKKIEDVVLLDEEESESGEDDGNASHLKMRKKSKVKPRKVAKDSNAEPTSDLWKGWTMTADGKVDYYDIPQNGDSEGLLVNSIGHLNKFGHKSIVVAFGNIMKVLYLGNDDLIYNDDNQRPPVNEEISGLSFVNKRRKNLRKNDSVNVGNLGIVGGPHGAFNDF